MIDYELTEMEKELQKRLRALCREEIAPHAPILANGAGEEIRALLPGRLRKLAAAGYMETLVRGDFVAQCVAGEEVAKACPSTFLAAMSSGTAFGRTLAVFGTQSQRSRFLDGIVKGEVIGALAATEATGGSDLGGIVTEARPAPGGWVLEGAKDLVTNAPLADTFLVLAWTNRESGLDGGLSFFLVDRGAPGLEVGETVETMGLRGAPTAGITLRDCFVPSDALVGGEGGGMGVFSAVSCWLGLAMSAMSVGIGVACMEVSTRQGKQKRAFGKPIGHFEGVGAKLAVMFTHNDLGRMLTLRAAWALDRGAEDGAVLVSCAKVFTGESVNKIADLAMQTHGGHGYLRGTDIERLYRDARFAELAYGTTERQRVSIARDGLGRFR